MLVFLALHLGLQDSFGSKSLYWFGRDFKVEVLALACSKNVELLVLAL